MIEISQVPMDKKFFSEFERSVGSSGSSIEFSMPCHISQHCRATQWPNGNRYRLIRLIYVFDSQITS